MVPVWASLGQSPGSKVKGSSGLCVCVWEPVPRARLDLAPRRRGPCPGHPGVPRGAVRGHDAGGGGGGREIIYTHQSHGQQEKTLSGWLIGTVLVRELGSGEGTRKG